MYETINDFGATVIRNLFARVMPAPSNEFQISTKSESLYENAPPFPCILMGIVGERSAVTSCGNDIVEGDEECDCGYEDTCDDKCCHAQTEDYSNTDACKLKMGVCR